jgi:hypothetical protein
MFLDLCFSIYTLIIEMNYLFSGNHIDLLGSLFEV